MANEDPMDWVRVKDKDTGYDTTIRRISLPHGNYQVLKQDALDALGEPLPPDFHLDDAAPATDSKKESAS